MNSTAAENSSWVEFIESHLLQYGIIDGVCLISKLGKVLYQSGDLEEIAESEVDQFLLHFMNTRDEDIVMQRGLCVTVKGSSMSFHINRKTQSSVYTIADGSQKALLVGNLPYGVLLCSYTPTNETAGKAMKQFEQACSLLRT